MLSIGVQCSAELLLAAKKKKRKRINKPQKPVTCEFCSRVFRSRNGLTCHLANKHGQEELFKFSCQMEGCGKRFLRQDLFQVHMNAHSGIRNFLCDICGQSYGSKSARSHHQVRCMEKRDNVIYDCQICRKTFNTNADLKQHMQKHGDSRVGKSCTCGKTFTFFAGFYRHRKICDGKPGTVTKGGYRGPKGSKRGKSKVVVVPDTANQSERQTAQQTNVNPVENDRVQNVEQFKQKLVVKLDRVYTGIIKPERVDKQE